MKKIIIVIAIAVSGFTALDDILVKTGTNEAAIKKSIIEAAISLPEDNTIPAYIAGGNEYISAYKLTRAIVLDKRGAAVKEMGNYFKQYYKSPAFKTDLDAALVYYKPEDFFKDSAYWQEQYDTDYKFSTDAFAKTKAQLSSDLRIPVNVSLAQSNAGLDMAEKMIKEHPELAAKAGMTQAEIASKLQEARAGVTTGKVKANDAMDKNFTREKTDSMLLALQKGYDDHLAEIKEKLKTSLAYVPEDRKAFNEKMALYKKKSNYRLNLSIGLSRFLAATADVDFNAGTTEKNNMKVFVNPAYENKNSLWKSCYRAGKEATEAARKFAEQWANELK